jgi:hypothetical protein
LQLSPNLSLFAVNLEPEIGLFASRDDYVCKLQQLGGKYYTSTTIATIATIATLATSTASAASSAYTNNDGTRL